MKPKDSWRPSYWQGTLKDVRLRWGVTQVQVAERTGLTQSEVSKKEMRLSDAKIATVRTYIEALGGELEVIARFGDERILLLDRTGKKL